VVFVDIVGYSLLTTDEQHYAVHRLQASYDWLELGKSYLQHRDRKGNVENAIQAFRQAVTVDGQDAAAWAALGEISESGQPGCRVAQPGPVLRDPIA
jgi:Flp pilus assembly protein TadD